MEAMDYYEKASEHYVLANKTVNHNDPLFIQAITHLGDIALNKNRGKGISNIDVSSIIIKSQRKGLFEL